MSPADRDRRSRAPARKGRRWTGVVLGAALASALLAAALLFLPWVRQEPALLEPPRIDTRTADPAVVKAVDAAREAVRRSPDSAAAWGTLGMVLFIHDDFADAEVCFGRAAELDPASPRWPYLRGLALFRGDARPQEAVACLRRAVERSGGDQTPRLRLGEALFELGQGAEAERLFREVLERDPRNPRAHLGLGYALHARGELRDALGHLESSARIAPAVKTTRLLLAEIHFRLGAAAAASRERALADRLSDVHRWPDPYFNEAREHFVGLWSDVQRANYLFEQGKRAEAIELLEGTVAMYPDGLMAFLTLGQLQSRAGLLEEAERTLRQAVRLSPDGVEACFELGAVLQLRGKHREAVEQLERAMSIKPDFALAHYRAGQSLMALGDVDGALEALRDTVRYRPDFAEARRVLGRLLASRNLHDEAIVHLREALRLDPSDEETRRLVQALETSRR